MPTPRKGSRNGNVPVSATTAPDRRRATGDPALHGDGNGRNRVGRPAAEATARPGCGVDSGVPRSDRDTRQPDERKRRLHPRQEDHHGEGLRRRRDGLVRDGSADVARLRGRRSAATVTITVAVPASAALGNYTGSVSVRSGKKALANSLPLTLHVVAPTAHLYWTNASVGIGRAFADGSNPDSVFIPAADAGQPVGLARDAQHIYWTDVNNHRIGRANLDGTNPDPNFLPLTYLDPGDRSTQPIGIAIDGQYIYWSDADYPSIGRANLDGSNVLPGFIDLSTVTCGPGNPSSCALPTGIAVDGQHIYWADEVWQGGSIGRADLNGANINQSLLIIGGGTEWGVAVDAQHLYWTWSVYPGDGFVGRSNLDGSNANSSFISTHAYATVGLAIDASHIYWSNNFGVNGQIGRADLDGSNVVAALVDLPGGASVGLAVDP